MITDPRFAPRRTDLPYLRRRSNKNLRATAPVPPAAPSDIGSSKAAPTKAAPTKTGPTKAAPANAVADFIAGGGPHPDRHAHPAVRPSAPQSQSQPTPSGAPVSSSLDLDSPAPAPAVSPVATPSTTLDLDTPPTPAPAPQSAPPAAPPARIRAYPVQRVTAGGRTILSATTPTVTLTRTQSGIGTLTIEAACSAEVGDLRLGCAYQLRTGASSTMQASGGNRLAPPRSRRPVLIGGHDRYERISVDLRQARDIERLAVFAFSESGAQLQWGGTLIVTTFAGAKIEVPLEHLAPGGVAVLLSLYNVAGEFVLRAELETIAGSIREAARAYGYDRITWLDDRNPVE